MKDDTVKNYLLNKMSIIDKTGDEHWLFTPLSLAIDRIEELNKVERELEVYKKRLVDVETENKAIRKELATYMRALEHACTRLEGYDLIFDREYGCYASKWNRKRWELWAIDKAEEDLKNE